MTDHTDLIARLRAADPMQVIGWDGREAAAAIEALHAERGAMAEYREAAILAQEAARIAIAERNALRKAAERALREAVADDMDEWFADLRAALTGSPR